MFEKSLEVRHGVEYMSVGGLRKGVYISATKTDVNNLKNGPSAKYCQYSIPWNDYVFYSYPITENSTGSVYWVSRLKLKNIRVSVVVVDRYNKV